MPNETIPDFEALKARMKATWMAGDFGQVAKYAQQEALKFISRQNIKPGMRVLDVACGTGNLAIPAAKAGVSVTGVDIAPNLVEQARERAKSEGVKIQFDEGDAEELPYSDASFDVVVSMFGAMFAPRPDRVAAELLRVCRPGGQLALANWTPDGFIGQMFKTTSKHLPPPPPGAPVPPVLWGDEATVRERFGDGVSQLVLTPVMAQLRYPFSVPETVEFFRTYYGPTQKAFAALSEDRQPALRRDMENLFGQNNKASDGTTSVEAEYLEVVATRA
jgi:ubiquinone/menaquinone biosynthesis C-methylase UbiE